MKTKTFFAASMREALNKVKEEFGSEAILLEQQEVPGGIELKAGIHEATVTENHEELYHPAKIIASDESPSDDPIEVRDFILKHTKLTPIEPEILVENKPSSADPQLITEIFNELKELRYALQYQTSQFVTQQNFERNPYHGLLYRKLFHLGFHRKVCRQICAGINYEQNFQNVWEDALQHLENLISIDDIDLLEKGGVVALIGPTGVGKTTTIAKLATRFCLEHHPNDLVLITTDSYRVAGREQLFTYGRLLGVPVEVVNDGRELNQILNHYREKKLILIDTAGVSQRDNINLAKNIELLSSTEHTIRAYLTLTATSQINVLNEIVDAFNTTNLAGLMVTKLDESTQLGAIISAAILHHLNLTYFSTGQHVPEDLQQFSKSQLIKLLVQSSEAPEGEQPEENFLIAGEDYYESK
ncbi:MAG: flagellar biosynthesis protein FlhF [Legionellales bacterium]|nr:flagellar biosynthesis protein FlhF [Legionellales bacterium]